MAHQLNDKLKSVKSINPFKSVIQTSYDIIKAHGEKQRRNKEARPDEPVSRSDGKKVQHFYSITAINLF